LKNFKEGKMAVRANIGTYTPPEPEEAVYSEERHPAVVLTKSIKAEQGVLERGTIVALNADGLVVPYNPSANDSTGTPVGVLVERVDTDKETVGNVLVHGVVFRERLVVKGSTVSEGDLKKLADIGIYSIG
jgi:hypothetical protein